MVVTMEGLDVTDKELRALLIVSRNLNNWKCLSTCKECPLESYEGECKMVTVLELFNDLIDIVML